MIFRLTIPHTLRRTPLRFFAAPQPPAPPQPAGADSGPVEVPGRFGKDNIFFSDVDTSIKRERKFHYSKVLHDVTKKRLDMMMFEETLTPKQPVIIHPLRMRHDLDTIDHLHSKRLVPLHVYPRGIYDGIDVVLDQRQVQSLRGITDIHYRPIYLRVDNENVRCSFDSISMAPSKQYYFKVYLNRYIVGKPNIINVVVDMPISHHDAFAKKQLNWYVEEIKLVSYNEVNPSTIMLDYKRLARTGRVTYGDLQNMLPKGLELLPKDKQHLTREIVNLVPLNSKREADVRHRMKLATQDDTVTVNKTIDDPELGVEAVKQLNLLEKKEHFEMLEKRKANRPAPNAVSFKKMIKDEQARLKIELEKKLAKENVLMGNVGKAKK